VIRDRLLAERSNDSDHCERVHHVDPSMLVSGVLNPETEVAVRAHMLQVNDLIRSVYAMAQRESESSRAALRQLNELLRKELGLAYKLQFTDETLSPEPRT
jgi:hypothetical protein